MRVLVTRPREDAETVAAPLRERGLKVVIEPLLEIAPIQGVNVDVTGVQGILATSANGVRALASLLPDRSLPVWAVGDASARIARELGYERVESAGGDVFTLAELVIQRCDPAAGPFLHAAASVIAGDLSGRLEAKGFQVRREVLYEAKPAVSLSDGLVEQLRAGGVERALFFSPRTAATFVTLAREAGVESALTRVSAHALSPAVASVLQQISWAEVRVAAAPTQAALLATLDHDAEPQAMPETAVKPDDSSAADPASTPTPAEAHPTEAKPTEAEPASSWKPIAAAVGLIAVIGGGVVGWSEWQSLTQPQPASAPPAASASASDNALDELKTELAATREHMRSLEARLAKNGGETAPLDSRVAQVENALRAVQNQPPAPARLSEEVQSLSKQVGELHRTSADAAAVLRLVDRVEKVEAEMRDMHARRSSAATLLLAVGQLREAVQNSLPYDGELRALRALAPEDEDVARTAEILKPRAVAGIPTRPTLTARFETLTPAIIRAQVLPGETGWLRQSLDRLAALVSIRREDGSAAGDAPAALAARAAARLAENDLAAAIAEVERFSDGAAEAAAPWLADAKARLSADKALADVTAHVVAAVGAKP